MNKFTHQWSLANLVGFVCGLLVNILQCQNAGTWGNQLLTLFHLCQWCSNIIRAKELQSTIAKAAPIERSHLGLFIDTVFVKISKRILMKKIMGPQKKTRDNKRQIVQAWLFNDKKYASYLGLTSCWQIKILVWFWINHNRWFLQHQLHVNLGVHSSLESHLTWLR